MPSLTGRQRYKAVMRLLQGDATSSVASELGIPETDLIKWQKQFVRAGRRALEIDFECDNAVPTLDALLSVAQKGFPYFVLADARSCAGFFAARFYGKNDIIHLYRAKIPDVHVVDIDGPRIEAMRQIYPSSWSYVTADVFQLVDQYGAEGREFDVVICDCYMPMAQSILLELLPKFEAITSSYLLIYGNEIMFGEMQASADAQSLSDALSAHHRRPVAVVDLPKRSSAHGGTYWVVLKVSSLGA